MNKMQQKLQSSRIAACAQGQKERGINAWIPTGELLTGAGAGWVAEHMYYRFMPNLLAAFGGDVGWVAVGLCEGVQGFQVGCGACSVACAGLVGWVWRWHAAITLRGSLCCI